MNHITITDNAQRYIRIDKQHARQLAREKNIYICPVKLRPGFPFNAGMMLDVITSDTEFNRVVTEFTHFNCTTYDAGYYPAFYYTQPL